MDVVGDRFVFEGVATGEEVALLSPFCDMVASFYVLMCFGQRKLPRRTNDLSVGGQRAEFKLNLNQVQTEPTCPNRTHTSPYYFGISPTEQYG